jgi:cell shape-determining protein MreC
VEIKKNFIGEKTREELILENNDFLLDLEIFKESEKVINFLRSENLKLKEELNYQIKNETKRNFFNIIFDENSNIFSSILILDPEEKTKKNDLVFSKNNFLIGKISENISNISKIKLFSFLGEKNNFFIQVNSKIKIKVEGIGDGSGVIKILAPRDFVFEDMKKVFLLYENNISYIVGHLVDIKFKTQDTNKILFFKTFVNPSLLNKVQIQEEIEKNPITVILE